MRDKLQSLVEDLTHEKTMSRYSDTVDVCTQTLRRLNDILATDPPAVTVRAGWVAKDIEGVAWFSSKPSYREDCEWWDSNGAMHRFVDGAITDPWPDHPNGGPECFMEVK